MRLPEALPRPRLALLAGACAALAACAALQPGFAPLAFLAAALVAAAAIADLRLCVRPADLRLERRMAEVASHGSHHRVAIAVENRAARTADLELEEVWPAHVAPARPHLHIRLTAGAHGEIAYDVVPSRRGPIALPPAAVRVRGPLGLMARQGPALPAAEVRVYPDVAGVGRYELAARRQLTAELGVRAVRALGAGTEIEGLREYTPDDEYRRIDWKATARRGRPITRDLRAERSQHVLILIDAGRLGAVELGAGQRIDHAVNAALVLAYVAAVRGDRVGLLVFDREIRRYLPPGRASRAVVPLLARALYDVEARPVESDYDRAFRHLSLHDRRRALLVLFSDLLSPEASQSMVAHLAQSVGRHLPLLVALDDPALGEAARVPVTDAASVYRRAAAVELRAEREAALRATRERGALVLDVPPAAATPAVVSRYLELKARHLL
jgi:uncharacterized protein (DUF58 family)